MNTFPVVKPLSNFLDIAEVLLCERVPHLCDTVMAPIQFHNADDYQKNTFSQERETKVTSLREFEMPSSTARMSDDYQKNTFSQEHNADDYQKNTFSQERETKVTSLREFEMPSSTARMCTKRYFR
ncbi:hypothetical protein QE152_g4965 [Popillia japonica]|uniref:Uncharacterized protein n=1 Tax=Popillia japonica TaxID=7064 RepID=A0AAW1MVV4_POPJA